MEGRAKRAGERNNRLECLLCLRPHISDVINFASITVISALCVRHDDPCFTNGKIQFGEGNELAQGHITRSRGGLNLALSYNALNFPVSRESRVSLAWSLTLSLE